MGKILLAGSGWGAIAAFNSLRNEKSVELHICTPDEKWRKRLKNEGYHCIDALKKGYDLIVCAGWRSIIPDNLLSVQKIVNIHNSLLPAYRGFHATVWAILNDEPLLGFTIHRVNKYIDDGPIIYQYSIRNDFSSTASWYVNHFNDITEEVLWPVLSEYLEGTIRETPQNKSRASWVGMRNANDCRIDFNRNIAWQKAFFRALTPPYPYPFFTMKDEKLLVTKAAFHENDVKTHTGRILNIDGDGVWISCDGGYIICKKIIAETNENEIRYDQFRIGQFANTAAKKPSVLV